MNYNVILINILLVFVYSSLALVVGLFESPVAVAPPVWPSAGIALAFLLRYGNPVLPGILIGALLSIILFQSVYGTIAGVELIFLAAVFAAGAAFQGIVAERLLFSANVSPMRLSSGNDILRFLFLSGPVGSIINPMTSTSISILLGVVEVESGPMTFCAWWVADSVGTLVMLPIALQVMNAFDRDTSAEKPKNSLLPLAFLLLIVVLYGYVRALEHSHYLNRIAEVGRQFRSAMNGKMVEISTVLQSVRRFYEASDFVSRKEFIVYCSPLVDDYPEIASIEWMPLVSNDQRALFEYQQSGGSPQSQFQISATLGNGQLVNAPSQAQYLPVTYRYPDAATNLGMIGLDRLSMGHESGPLSTTLSTGEIRLIGPASSADPAQPSTYALVQASASSQQEGYVGVIRLAFHMDEILQQIGTEDGLLPALQLVDITDPGARRMIHRAAENVGTPLWDSSFGLMQRRLNLQIHATPALNQYASGSLSYALLIGGLFYVALLEAVMMAMRTRQQFIEHQVAIKTKELAQAKDAAEQANQGKTNFLATISHEFRTPLNSVLGFTRRILAQSSDQLEARALDGLKIVERNARQLLTLINDVQDVTRLESGTFELKIDRVRVQALLEDAVVQLTPAIKARNNQLELKSEFPDSIEGDQKRLRQIIVNLLSNANKYTEGGKIALELVPQHLGALSGVLLTVQDNGRGIDPDDLPKLFNKFETNTDNTRVNPEGLNLGLALTKDMVELHQGKIRVQSLPGKGSAFSVWLPVKQQMANGSMAVIQHRKQETADTES